jgi:acetyl esterase/lipase
MVAMSANCSEMEGDVGGNQEYTSTVKAATIFYAPSDLVALFRNNANKVIKNLSETEVDNAGKSMDNVITQILGYTELGKSLVDLYQLLESGDTEDLDWKYIELAKRCSPISYVSANCPPMMILHGGKDPLVPIDQSESLYKALVSSNADAMYFSSSQANHGPTMGDEADQVAYQFLKNRL